MAPLAEWVLVCGEDVVEAVRLLEQKPAGGDKKITHNSFRCLESMYDPSDFRELAVVMRDESVKQTPSRLRSEATRIIRNRWWSWILTHPQLKSTHIHPDRRV